MDITRLFAMICFYYSLNRATALPLNVEDSDEDDENPTTMMQMGQHLRKIPLGRFSITSANFGYNSIQELPAYVLYVNFYKNLQVLQLQHNEISGVDQEAFKEVRQLKTVDLSSNNISFLDPNTFRFNHRLEKVDLAYNNISFDPEKPFLRSHTMGTLVLSNNQIINVYDITFARLPNLRTLLLDSNTLDYLSPNCFVHLRQLQYVNLANTGVHRLANSMFKIVPRLIDLSGTTLAKKFEPPLTTVKSVQLTKLMNIENYILGDDYVT